MRNPRRLRDEEAAGEFHLHRVVKAHRDGDQLVVQDQGQVSRERVRGCRHKDQAQPSRRRALQFLGGSPHEQPDRVQAVAGKRREDDPVFALAVHEGEDVGDGLERGVDAPHQRDAQQRRLRSRHQTPPQQVGRNHAGGEDQRYESQGAEAGDGRTGGRPQDGHQGAIDRGEQRCENEERAPERDDDGEARQEVPLEVLRDGHATKKEKWGQSPFSMDSDPTYSIMTAVPLRVTNATEPCVGSTSRRAPTTPLPPCSIASAFRSASARATAWRSRGPIGPALRRCRVCPSWSRSSGSPIRTATVAITSPAYPATPWVSRANCVVTGTVACCVLDCWGIAWAAGGGGDSGAAVGQDSSLSICSK